MRWCIQHACATLVMFFLLLLLLKNDLEQNLFSFLLIFLFKCAMYVYISYLTWKKRTKICLCASSYVINLYWCEIIYTCEIQLLNYRETASICGITYGQMKKREKRNKKNTSQPSDAMVWTTQTQWHSSVWVSFSKNKYLPVTFGSGMRSKTNNEKQSNELRILSGS